MIGTARESDRAGIAWPVLFLDAIPGADRLLAPSDQGAHGAPLEPVRHRVLIIEDNEDAANGLCEYLELLGHEACVAHTGSEGLRIARELRPTLVLCDIGLPEMDGWEVARALRADPAMAGVRMIAITGYGSDEDRKKSKEAGFEAHLTKPINMELLDAALGRAD